MNTTSTPHQNRQLKTEQKNILRLRLTKSLQVDYLANMVPLLLLAIPIFFAKEVYSNDLGKTLNCRHVRDEDDEDYDSSSSVYGVSLSSSCVSSFDDVSIDESYVDEATIVQLCSLLGPRVAEDEKRCRARPNDLPPNLHDSTVISLPVGFYRLRRGFLSQDSRFWNESILKYALGYQE